MPSPSASEDPKASISSMPSWCRRRPCLDSSLHITPDEMMAVRLVRSHRPGSASRAARIGRAKASPTITAQLTCRSTIVSSSSTGSNWREVRVTTRPPSLRHSMAVNPPVPCMSGHAGSRVMPAPVAASSRRSPSTPPSGGYLRNPPPLRRAKRSSWRHMTPLGIPVVPPVYSMWMSSGPRPHGARTRSCPAGPGAPVVSAASS